MSEVAARGPSRGQSGLRREDGKPEAAKPPAKPQAQAAGKGASAIGWMTVAAIAFGFIIRGRELIVPAEGMGYKLGLYGGLIMLALLAYPAFKRTRLFGSGKYAAAVFRFHMLLGIIGPLMIFYHTNFSFGALNSNIALVAMILVAGSGVIGRYIYTRVHVSLAGARYDVGALLTQATRLMAGIEEDVGGSGGLVSAALAAFSNKATPRVQAFLPSLRLALSIPMLAATTRRSIMKDVSQVVSANAARKGWNRTEQHTHIAVARDHVDEFLLAVSRASQMAFWERAFSLWHVLHVPLFFLLLVSGVIHVVAVHLY